ncbi:GGDEF domain-containing protein [Deinococcus cellulosilyticus]|uniref:GGDEF domain-containing protein n=1 Tax=Deinococcus cellulosilyticus (strain DSM 18568 / NBRC 106333 / KACC 11606 / 5516J-15) TaxID=1223518 RepID=A0A511N9U3_DEIC1|nr:GGDEF domain-containing protein [Deinococcus cellulosilyticus]GEM49337.1 hypothetical protein DC3_49720 [Deinococcus cellulosilyticus NBRC 106333 = KACC 11606]
MLKIQQDRLQFIKWSGLFLIGSLGLLFPQGTENHWWMLPLLGVLVAFLWTRTSAHWTAAKVGVLLWSMGKVAFALDAEPPGHVLILLGYLLWAWNLVQLKDRTRSGMSLTLFLPLMAGVLAAILLKPTSLQAVYPLLDLFLLVLALPSLQAFMEGRTSLGRSIWITGLYALLATDLSEAFTNTPNHFLVYALIYTAFAYGIRLEEARQSESLTPITASAFVLLCTAQLVSHSLLPHEVGLLHFYLAFMGIFGLLLALRNHQKLTQKQFQTFNTALLTMLDTRESSYRELRMDELAVNLFENLRHILPELKGLQLEGTDTVLMGNPTPLLREEKVYMEGRPSTHVTFYFSEMPAQKHALEATINAAKYVIQYAARQHAMQAQLFVDPLTGVSNQRALPGITQRFEGLSSRQGSPVTLCLLDLDHFKKINDQHGHEVGDKALKLTATLIRKQLRGEDDMVRWGSDEFMIFLYNCTPEQAAGTLTRIRQKLKLFSQDRLGFTVSFSVGIAGGVVSLPGDLGKWMLSADLHLLDAKVRGRNQTISGG